MRTDRFDYSLPDSLIARWPSACREDSRLLVLRRDGVLHLAMGDFAELVPPGAVLVVNDTRVLKARIVGSRRGTGGRAELLLLRPLVGELSGLDAEAERWTALGHANRPLRPGAVVESGALTVEVLEHGAEGVLTVEVRATGGVRGALDREGHVPIPPYLRREDEACDVERYQTVYARREGSVAAPTAGLHLTEALLERLADRRVVIGRLTLHVGLGTFRPVTADDLDRHPMHAEWFAVAADLGAAIAAARQRGAPVVAIGTTVVRALESAADPERDGHVRAMAGETRLLIQPGYRFRVVDALLTNFHQPRSTLLALVAAFAGRERTLAAYQEALERQYRFLSYGDAMWIPRRLT